jgi:hypothetical protein
MTRQPPHRMSGRPTFLVLFLAALGVLVLLLLVFAVTPTALNQGGDPPPAVVD